MLLKSRFVAALSLFVALVAAASGASAQDTRTVNEPAFPATCTTLTAQQAIVSGEPTSETAFDTSRIQAALAACGSGKAVELTTSGTNNAFLIAPITIPTGVTLLVDAGVTVFGSRNPADYQSTATGVETCGTVGTKGNGCNPLITASNTTGAGVMGYGIVNGRGGDKLLVNGTTQTTSWWDIANNANTANGAQNNPILLYATKAPGFVLYKITLMNSPMFHVKYQNASGFTAWGIKIVAPYSSRNTDGIDPTDNVSNVTIANAYISDGDDNIALGATSGNPVSNVTVNNLHTYSGHGVSIGSYTAGGVSNVAVTNLNMAGNTSDTNAAGLKIKSAQDRGGLVNNVQYTNVCIQNERYPLQFNPTYNTNTGTSYPQYSNIGLHNVSITSLNNSTYQFQGLNANVPLGITFDNLNIAGGVLAAPLPQYATITLGPGPVTPVQLQQFAGRGVTYTGNITNPSEAAYRCPSTNYPFLAGELFLSTTGTGSVTNAQSVSIANNASVTLNAVVEPVESASTTPTSAIQFYEGTTQVGTGTLAGNGTLAQLTLSNLTSGAHTYTARYPADSAYAVVNFGSVTVNVNTTATTTTLTATPASATYGNNVALVATVVQGSGTNVPTGTVSFQSGGSVVGTATLDATGKATLNSTTLLPVGTNSVAAYFLGSTNFAASNSNATPTTVTIAQAGTSNTVAATPANAAYGSTVTVTTTVAPATSGQPTGTVTILDGGTAIGTATISGTQAVFTTNTLAAGVHNLTAQYGGDTNYTASTSTNTAKVTIVTASTTTSLGFTSGTVAYGASVTMIATINNGNAATASGTVNFTDNGQPLATVTINVGDSSASYTTSALPLGSNSITATYSGDSNYTGSTATAPLVVTQAGTSTTLAATSSTPTYGSQVTFTATVTPTSSGSPTGTVTFKDGSQAIGTGTVSGNKATFGTSTLAGGAHSITATYAGDMNYTGSTSTAFSVTVGTAATTTVLAQPAAITYGATAQLSATVSSSVTGTLTGSVTFLDGSKTLGSGTSSGGVATLSAPGLAGGAHSITAVYSGDTNFATSTSAAATLTVNKASSTVNVGAAPGTLTYGQSTTFTANIAPTGATGTVTFTDGSATVGTATVQSNGTASLTTGVLTAGTHTISASYGGDGNYAGASSTSSATVTVSQASSTVTVAASPQSFAYGNSTVLTATVSSGATGTVTFRDGAATLGTATVSGSMATITASALTGGTHSITAVYAGDSNFTTSTSTAVSVSVSAAATTTTVTAAPSTFGYGASTTLTATIASAAAGSTRPGPSGSVNFYDGSTLLGSGTVSGGSASFAASGLTAGSHPISAVYAGDSNYATSTASVVSVTVNQAATTTAVAANPATITYGSATTLTATVTGSGATGTVTFRDGSAMLGSAALSGGSASFTASSLGGGTHLITSIYRGDTNFASSTSAATTVTVNTLSIGATIVASPATAGFGSPITFTVTLANTAATGSVVFREGSTTLGQGIVTNGSASFTTSGLSVATHAVTGNYSGDANFSAVTTAPVSVSITPATTTSSVTANPPTLTFGGATLLTATVSNTAATGTFTFRDGMTVLGTGTVANGVATFNATSLAAGSHLITATYSGDGSYATSTSPAVTVVVNTLATTTTLAANPTATNYGASTTLTATVSNNNATGTVTFRDGSNAIGTATVANGLATFSTSTLTVGSHAITASYGGDNNYGASASTAVTVTVSAATTTTTLAASPAAAAFGTATAITASVAPAGATGTVTFRDGSAVIGTTTLAGGNATLSYNFTAGTHTLSASYAGDGNYAASATTTSFSVTISVAASSVSVTATPASTPLGTAVSVAAAVSPAAATGTVVFRDTLTGLALGTSSLSNGTATLPGVLLSPAGAHGITATYSGDTNVGGSTSPAVTVIITPGVSTTTLTNAPASPTTYGTSLTFSTVNAAQLNVVPTGTMTYADGASTLGTATLVQGATSFSTSALTPGAHTITATYSGDANYLASSASVTLTVGQATAVTTLTATPSQTVPGQAFTLSATAAAMTGMTGTPGGTVTFYNKDTNANLGTATLSNGSASLQQTLQALGTVNYLATFSGDANFSAPPQATVQVIVKQLPSTVTIVASPTSGTFGVGTYMVSSTVSSTGGGSPSGTVTYRDVAGKTPVTLGTATVSGGQASLANIMLGGGAHSIVAFYSGDPTYVSSDTAANPASITVATAASTTSLTVTPATSTFGTSVTFAASVTSATGTAATGMVAFTSGGTTLGSGTLNNGTYSFTTSTLAIGSYNVAATYSGDANFSASSSGAAAVTVNKIPQTITLTGVPASLTYGAAPFVVGASSNSGLAVTLSVSGPATLNGSTVTVTGAGTVTLTATQAGNATYAAATTVMQSVAIAKAAITVAVTNQSILAGNAIPTLTGSFTGVVNGDAITVGYSTTATSASAPGTYPITATLADPNGRLTNYTVSNTPGTLTITANSQTITFPAIPTSAVYGVSPITLGATASSKLAVSYTVSGPATLNGSVLTVTGTGPVTVTASQAGNNTYGAATPVSQTITISPAPLVVTVDNKSVAANAAIPVLTGTLGGVVNGDSISVSYATTATQTSAPGTYPITATLADPNARLGNYTVTNTPGTLTITTNTQTLTFPALASSVTYGQAPVTLAATASSGLAVTYTVTGPATLTGTTLAYTGAGTVTVTAAQAGNAYYAAATSITQTITVAKANLSVVVNSASRVYGAANPTLTGTLTGVVNGDAITVSYATTATATSAVGTYPITGTLADPNSRLGNYNVSNTPGTLTVTASTTAVALTVSPSTSAAGSAVTFTAQVSANGGNVTSGTVTFLNGAAALGTASVTNGTATLVLSNLAVGSYSVTASYAASGNFAAATSSAVPLSVVAPVTASLNPASLTLTAGAAGSSTLSVTPAGGFTGAVSASCSSPVSYITCSVGSLAAVTGTSAVTTTVSINVASMAALTVPRLGPSRFESAVAYAALLPFGALLLLPAVRRRGLLPLRSVRLLTLALFALATSALITGCGGSSFNDQHLPPTGTNAVTITVTANGIATTTTLNVTITR